ncbi:MAG: phosphatase PAP2 family protein [Chloroflexota bacterium]|nr:phosphatase PAP2 family protein [Chloroflexota bacterium]
MRDLSESYDWRAAARERLDALRESTAALGLSVRPEVVDEDTSEDSRRALEAVERALEQVDSEEAADRLIDELELRHVSQTQEDVEEEAPAPGLSPQETVHAEVAGAPPEAQPAAALQSVLEQTTGEQGEEAAGFAQALHERMARPQPESVAPHVYLQRAVLKRMSPVQALDAWLYIGVNRLPHSGFLNRFMAGVSTVSMHGAGWTVGALLLAARDKRRGRTAAAEMIPALLVTNTLVERVIKFYFRRRRPFITLVKALVVGHKPGSWSFPSGHSACSFACASALGRRYRRRRPLLYSLAALVGFSRVYLGHHYPTDVLSGATIGEVMSRLVVTAVRRVRTGKGGGL